VIVGAALVSGLLTVPAGPVGFGLGAGLLLAGAALLTTAVTGSCPLYRAFGIDTFRPRRVGGERGRDRESASRDDADGRSGTPPN
jgi:hypothetical protein